MKVYQDLLRDVLQKSVDKEDRTGTGTRSLFGYQMRFDLKEGFPLVTTKKTSFSLIKSELLWFLQGNPDISFLHENNNHIWDEWVKADGTFGDIYGKQWRSWSSFEWENTGFTSEDTSGSYYEDTIDQIANVIEQLKTNPDSRRLIVSAWNVADVEAGEMALPPCHILFQFYTRVLTVQQRIEHISDGGFTLRVKETFAGEAEEVHLALDKLKIPRRALSCQLYQRSADSFLGVPFNIASYALLTSMIAQCVNMVPDEFIWTGGDTHIYHNHFDQVEELLRNKPKPLCKLVLNPEIKNIDDFCMDDIKVVDYVSAQAISAPIAV